MSFPRITYSYPPYRMTASDGCQKGIRGDLGILRRRRNACPGGGNVDRRHGGTADAWRRFKADWEAVIDDFREDGLRAFRAYDCEVGDGDFVNFSSENSGCDISPFCARRRQAYRSPDFLVFRCQCGLG